MNDDRELFQELQEEEYLGQIARLRADLAVGIDQPDSGLARPVDMADLIHHLHGEYLKDR